MPANIDEYIASFPPEVQAILQQVRLTITQAVPDAQESISYNMPTFTLNGTLVYFAAFKKHIGFYPPVKADAKLAKALSPYAGEKGNLRFPLDQPIPYALIGRAVKVRAKQNLSKARHHARTSQRQTRNAQHHDRSAHVRRSQRRNPKPRSQTQRAFRQQYE